MRPSFEIGGHSYREITLWKAIVLSIVTLGIYFLVVTYQNTKDIQEGRTQPFTSWKLVFWLGVIPFLQFLHIILWVFNWIGVKELRASTGQSDDPLGIVALILAILVAPIGQILWAIHFNQSIHAPAA